MMRKLTIVIHYLDDVKPVDPVLIEEFVQDNFVIANIDACEDKASDDEIREIRLNQIAKAF